MSEKTPEKAPKKAVVMAVGGDWLQHPYTQVNGHYLKFPEGAPVEVDEIDPWLKAQIEAGIMEIVK